MHGLIFVTWEKYLSERFGLSMLQDYRNALGETAANAPLASKVYDDAMLLAGVATVQNLTRVSVDTLLREYGAYFITNGLTSSRCSYLLLQAHDGRELLLLMRSAHIQMRRGADGLTPPVFSYEIALDQSDTLALIYDSDRQLCPLLYGAIEGAAKRYGQKVAIYETSCMRHGDKVCRFEITFSNEKSGTLSLEGSEQMNRQKQQQHIDEVILHTLPWQKGVTLTQLQGFLQTQEQIPAIHLRISRLLASLEHLSHAGLVANSANDPDDTLTSRRYWRAPTYDFGDA
jgi:hypothetical protein